MYIYIYTHTETRLCVWKVETSPLQGCAAVRGLCVGGHRTGLQRRRGKRLLRGETTRCHGYRLIVLVDLFTNMIDE